MSPNVATVSVTQTLGDVRRLMTIEAIHHLPVLDGRKLVGIVSALDVVSVGSHGANDDTRVSTFMSTDLVTLDLTDTILDAARHLRSGQLHSLPVVNDDGELVGIITSTDVIRSLYDQY